MAITLGTNLTSYATRINLNNLVDKNAKTMEKLSTGLKINSAGDDSAGLVISKNMETIIRGSKQAQANIQNATSFLTVAEDGMVSISGHLQRINDLLVNMANDTNDIESRSAAVTEILERIEEIDRLAESTSFNGKKMLNGDTDSIIIQMGPDAMASSVLDIAPALADCHIDALGATLPGKLNPHAKVNGTDIYYTRTEFTDDGLSEVKYYKEDQDGNVTEVDQTAWNAVKDNESAFAPTNENCRNYMTKVQEAISEVSMKRGLLGAFQNRMDSSYDSMTIRIESLETAKSHYTDTDIAEEATNLSTQQIMQQYNVAILANANTLPQLALSLLGA